jgi:hypothetical protein
MFLGAAPQHPGARDDELAHFRRKAIAAEYARLKAEDEAKLDARRAKLRDLFAREEAEWESRLRSLRVSREDRVSRLQQRVDEIRAGNEARRREFVEEQRNRLWQESCDDLRRETSQFQAHVVSSALKQQVATKIAREQNEAEYEVLFQQLEREELERERARAAADEAARKARIAETRAALDSQLTLQQRADAEKQLEREREAEAVRDTARAVSELEQLEVRRQHILHATRAAETTEYIAFTEAHRRAEAEARAREEREYVQQLQREAEAEEAAAQAAIATRKAAGRKFREHLLAQAGRAAEEEAQVERLYQDQADEVYNAQQAVRDREARARALLADECTSAQKQAMAADREARLAAAAAIKAEREAADRAFRDYQAQEAAKKAETIARRRESDEALKAQLAERARQRQAEIEAARQADKARAEARDAESRRIAAEIEESRQRLASVAQHSAMPERPGRKSGLQWY